VVWKLDRLARSLKQLIETVEELEGRKIAFRSLTDAIDTTSPGGRLVFHVIGALAQFERELIRERTQAGLDAAKKLGRKGGRPRSLDAKSLQAAQALLRDGTLTVTEIAARLGVATSTLYRNLPGGRAALPVR
jgi:DNA invertase Pin-like site-specific DNA recombinase